MTRSSFYRNIFILVGTFVVVGSMLACKSQPETRSSANETTAKEVPPSNVASLPANPSAPYAGLVVTPSQPQTRPPLSTGTTLGNQSATPPSNPSQPSAGPPPGLTPAQPTTDSTVGSQSAQPRLGSQSVQPGIDPFREDLPQTQSASIPSVLPPAIVKAKLMKQTVCKPACKSFLIRLELENPASIARFFILPPEGKTFSEKGGIRLARTYRFYVGENQIVMGEFEGSKSFRLVQVPAQGKVILKNVEMWFPETQPKPYTFDIYVTPTVMIESESEKERTIDAWLAGGANSQMTQPEVEIDLGPIGGNDYEGLAGAIEAGNHREHNVTFAAPREQLHLLLDSAR